MPKAEITKVDKPWGHELLWAKTADYVGKILSIRAGHRLSLQYHEVKEETVLVLKGKMTLVIENDAGDLEEIELQTGDAHHIAPLRRHRMIAIEDCEVAEVSTPHLADVVRIEDSYGREGTSQA